MSCTPVYARQPFPNEVKASIFLAGPTPRDRKNVASWRPDAIRLLEAAGFTGHVFVPEDPDGSFCDWEKDFPYAEQVEWEEEALHRADCILFWIPREKETMPGFTTNDEYGFWKSSGKVVLGTPPEAEKVRYQRYFAEKAKVPVFDSLEAATAAAASRVGMGAQRVGGECQVPLLIWNTKAFQNWHSEMKAAGNRLDGARMLWNFRVGPKKDFVFAWALHVDVHVTAENRNKVNEFIIARTDLSSVVLFHAPSDASNVDDYSVVLVKEFRSPVRNDTGFVVELPGGSAKDTMLATLNVACEEVHEETGFKLEPNRLVEIGGRQLAATFSTHKSHVFAGRLNDEEMQWFRDHAGEVHGQESDSERTYPQVFTVGELRQMSGVDWSTMGMILTTLVGEKP